MMGSPINAFDSDLKRSLAAELDEAVAEPSDHELAVVSELISRLRLARRFYLDEEVEGDGAFAILIAMFHDLARGQFTPVARMIESADVSLSTATYLIRIMESSGQIQRVKGRSAMDEAYTISPATERALRGLLRLTVDMTRITFKAFY